MTIHAFMTIAVFPISLMALIVVVASAVKHMTDPFFEINVIACIPLAVGAWAGLSYCLWVWGLLG